MSQERGPKTGQTYIYRDTPSNRAVGQKSRAPDALTHRHRMHSATSSAPNLATCLACSKFNGRFNEHRTRPMPSTQCLTPSVRCTPLSNQRQFSLTGHVWRWVNGCHCVRCTWGFKEAADVTWPPDAWTVPLQRPVQQHRSVQCLVPARL
jgi:hypothetical protein